MIRALPFAASRLRVPGPLAALLLGALWLPLAGAAQEEEREQEEVQADTAVVGELLRAIGAELGRLGAAPLPRDAALDAADIDEPPPRELLLHARELSRELDRLAREQHLSAVDLPPLAGTDASWADVVPLLELSLERLRSAGTSAGFARASAPAPLVAPSSRELLGSLVAAVRAAHELRTRPTSSGDVFFAVTRALAHCSSLRARWPGRRMPLSPPLESLVTNDDVHRVLARCWHRVEDLAELSGLARLALAPPEDALQTRPADLCRLATLLADELAILSARHGDPALLPPTRPSGDRRTSELLQRAAILERQLEKLAGLAAQDGTLGSGPTEVPP